MLYSKIEGQGNALVILHGFLGMSDNWKTLSTQYVALGFEVHAIDLRNHGRSFHSEEFNYEVMVQDVYDYCLDKNLKEISIIGHSMGGKVAMLFATLFTNKVYKLIVADIAPRYYVPHHEAILAGLNAVDFSKKPSRQEVDSILSVHVSDFGTRQFLLKNLYWQKPDQLAFRFNLAVFNIHLDAIGAALPEKFICSKPTLFVRGGNSDYISQEDFEDIKRHFPNSEIATIPEVGHWLHAENPILFLEITGKWLLQKEA